MTGALRIFCAEGATDAQQRYAELDALIRKTLWLRAELRGGMKYADAALGKRDAFVQICLLAQRQDHQAGPPAAEQSLKVSCDLLPAY